MENGVSSCGGRLVRPIIGRFCGYFTSGRSPLSKGSVTVSSANALTEVNPAAAPSAAVPARFIISRLSSIGLPPKLILSRPVATGFRGASATSARLKSIHAFGAGHDLAMQKCRGVHTGQQSSELDQTDKREPPAA